MKFWHFGAYLLVIQTTCPKAYKRTATNSNNYYYAHKIDDKNFPK
jgi:hypothetical protein